MSAAHRIEGASPSVAAFVGLAPEGPIDRPLPVSSWNQFVKLFGLTGHAQGPYLQGAFLAHAVSGFFDNGGSSCWVMRVESDDAADTVNALAALAAVGQITMVCLPEATTGDHARLRELQHALIEHCEAAGDRMAILDTPPGLPPTEVLDWRVDAGFDSAMAALYYPWLEVRDPVINQPLLVPPCGHVAGVWCRSDATRGVHKAPANEGIGLVTRLAYDVGQDQQTPLNAAGVNCIRSFPGRGTRVWGARTLSSDPQWQHLNVRRLVVNVMASLAAGIEWVGAEPNDERLWSALQESVSAYLQRVWRGGALAGSRAEDAFFARCDADTNPPDIVESGRVICQVGIAPVKPSEFVVFSVGQYTA